MSREGEPEAQIPRAAWSFRHPTTGEWAHFLLADPSEEAWGTYLEPIWARLDPEAAEPLVVVEVGFGRGFQTATLLQRWAAEGARRPIQVHAFEPFPELLEPWPAPPPSLAAWMPWWGTCYRESSTWTGNLAPGLAWALEVHVAEVQDPAPWSTIPKVDLYLVDLFSPGKHAVSWREPLQAQLAAHARSGSLLTTYTCARSVRDALRSYGWETTVLRRPGWRDTLVAHFPPTGKPRSG